MKKLSSVAALLVVLLATGCATIVDGPNQKITVQSEPSGATVSINGVEVGKTPVTADVKRLETGKLVVSMEGYKTQSLDMVTKLNTTFWGNVIIGGLAGSTTDTVSGAAREYTPGMYFVRLEK